MPARTKDPDLAQRFLEELSDTLDVIKTIKKLGMTEEEARSILKDLVKPKRPVQKALFGEDEHKRPVHKGVYTINVDGASRGNPGKAGAGAVIRDPDGKVIKKLKKFLGTTTNNVAEYQALVMALEAASELKLSSVSVLADSELMVKQINGIYKVKSEDLRPLYDKAIKLLGAFDKQTVAHIYREENSIADSLANEAIDRKG